MFARSDHRPHRPLSQDLTRRLILTVSAIFIVTSLVNYTINARESKARYVQRAGEYLAHLQHNLKVPLWNFDREWIGSICRSVANNEAVALLRVSGEDGTSFFEVGGEETKNLIVRRSDIVYRDKVIGRVELGLTQKLYTRRNHQILVRSILQMLFVILGLMLVTRLILERKVARPLQHLITRVDEIAAGEYREERHAFEHLETASILERFNLMAERVRARERSLIEANRRLEAEIAEREGAEKALRDSERRYRQLVEDLPVGIFRSPPEVDGPYLMTNPALRRMLGYEDGEEFGRRAVAETYQDPGMRRHIVEMIFREGSIQGVEIGFRKKDGAAMVGLVTAHGVTDADDRPRYIDGIIEDITERKNLERQIRQTQKMEAIGTLAGGIAHDFNNILSSIFGFAEVARMRGRQGRDVEGPLEEILNAGLRARSLVRQINTFSRQAEVRRQRIVLDPVIKETIKFLRASLPATIELRHRILAPERTVVADPTQIHQVLMNLCTNSAHAMDRGGLLEVTLDEVSLDPRPDPAVEELPPGRYLRLTVRDTGHGIQPAYIERIFEPFFTTKQRGEGTGMGLAMVHGIVRDMNGAVSVESQPGEGARFTVMIPRVEGPPEVAVTALPESTPGGARILFVDDEEGFTTSGREILAALGYEVVTATSGREAIERFEADPAAFDLVITDMVMPRMTGLELATHISRLRAGLPIILCTGFSTSIDASAKRSAGIRHTLMKPLLASELTEAIQGALKRTTE